MRIVFAVEDCSKIFVVSVVATQPFPCDVGRGHGLDMIVTLGGAPAGGVGCHRDLPLVPELVGESEFPAGLFCGSRDLGKG